MENNIITVLNFMDGKVYQYAIHGDICDIDFEEFLAQKGFSLGNIEWMSHSDSNIYTEND
jgi:hypothetical protein